MTAEIGVMNTIGVALAADSAVTFDSKKIFNSADKLFALSKFHPVGIMIYGNASFMGIPWETIIKDYRVKLGNDSFKTLEEYHEDFFKHLNSDDRFKSDKYETVIIRTKFLNFIMSFLNFINDTLSGIFQGTVPDAYYVQSIIYGELEYYARLYNNYDYSPGFDEGFFADFREKNEEMILEIINQTINVKIDHEILQEIMIIAFFLTFKNIRSDHETGIVFAGFGDSDIFPSLKSFMIEGFFGGVLKYIKQEDVKIDANNSAAVMPFAQQEMVHSFMTGIEPRLKQEVKRMFDVLANSYPEIVKTILDEKVSEEQLQEMKEVGDNIINEFNNDLQQMISINYSNPIIDTVAALPKEELAAMAEALVNLTSIKRKMSNQMETVGGPIDVAIISKGDGFIWIKRKHYFSKDLNHSYFQNYMER